MFCFASYKSRRKRIKMNRLPDRPEDYIQIERTEEKGSDNRKSFKDNMGIYGALLVIVALVFVLTQKVQVSYDEMTITDYTPKTDGTALFVVGELEDGQRFADSKVNINEETGVAEIVVYRYGMPTVFGTQDFVVMINAEEDAINEIWLSFTDSNTQEVQRVKLNYKTD